ncbi:inositol polyphosphate kinase family protein [Streptomyces sp. NPDC047097]|uniref:inositol polyphosphate kinase family protein n=1 Tax=Streptomyces sp. NPDC047097 TaxID=3155260 RepID=UPI0033DAFC7A
MSTPTETPHQSEVPPAEPNVNQGGHGGIRPLGEARQILAKPAPYDSVENEFYRRVRQGDYPGIEQVVPASYTAAQVRDILGGELSPTESAGLDDRTSVYIENITSGLDPVKTLDTKIGSSTTSFRENLAQQGKSFVGAGWKYMTFVFTDRATGSSDRGWRVVAGSDAAGNRLTDSWNSRQILRDFSDKPEVWEQLISKMEAIRDAAKASHLGFIASSVFSVHGTEDGKTKVDAKLIDFAHVIDARKPFGSPSPGTGGARSAPDLARAGADYRERFISGMDQLIGEANTILRAKAAQTAPAATSAQTRSPASPSAVVGAAVVTPAQDARPTR